MKKNYEAPKAEKMEFNYSETVVASGCDNTTTYTKSNNEPHCSQIEVEYIIADNGN